ncbi:response regulator transcription factor [Saccharothrix sp. NRRL B-16348]|uniref:response regulator transcription factor n=1 Tax=Saccharothrix sp. NRRL B-16348 TaxID=1415542 RepID=UPI001E3F9DD5|nr:response regulator transcription factor [Saccharothrix sp. NRRL B-16348]
METGEVVETMLRVLVAGGQSVEAELLVSALRRLGYDSSSVAAGSEALKVHPTVDMVLLDLELPDLDGLAVCRAIREISDTPIIAITRQDDELERVLALQAGADDVVTGSCGLREVTARIEAVARRTHPRRPDHDVISLCKLRIDRTLREVRLGGRVIDVTIKEFELLYTLASNAGTVVSRKELMSKVWDSSWSASSRTIDTHVSSLRGKLGTDAFITTVRGVGYQIPQVSGAHHDEEEVA